MRKDLRHLCHPNHTATIQRRLYSYHHAGLFCQRSRVLSKKYNVSTIRQPSVIKPNILWSLLFVCHQLTHQLKIAIQDVTGSNY